jgi:hypothetical protein
VHSAGDAIGVSQLIEGITGERLGTNMPLGSDARSTQFGSGSGNMATLMTGSPTEPDKAWASRLAWPDPAKPSGPFGNDPAPAPKTIPPEPRPNPRIQSVEQAARDALPPDLPGANGSSD